MINKSIYFLISGVLYFSLPAAHAYQDSHYMMASGEAHQGHEMIGNKHPSNSRVIHNPIYNTEYGGIKKLGDDYIMLGGEGFQGQWLGRINPPTASNDKSYKMSSGDL